MVIHWTSTEGTAWPVHCVQVWVKKREDMGREVSSSSEGRAVQVRVKKREEMGSEVPSSCTLDLHSRNGRACAGKG